MLVKPRRSRCALWEAFKTTCHSVTAWKWCALFSNFLRLLIASNFTRINESAPRTHGLCWCVVLHNGNCCTSLKTTIYQVPSAAPTLREYELAIFFVAFGTVVNAPIDRTDSCLVSNRNSCFLSSLKRNVFSPVRWNWQPIAISSWSHVDAWDFAIIIAGPHRLYMETVPINLICDLHRVDGLLFFFLSRAFTL